jgi:hypothetical protein
MSESFSLGLGHYFKPVFDDRGQFVGWTHTHLDPSGMACQSFCAVHEGYGAPVHQITQSEPLTLSPSLKCRMCGVHGNVINGRWEPC